MLTVLIPDVHVPEQDEAAVAWAFGRIVEERPSTVIFLGDVFDFKSISRFKKHPSMALKFREEVAAGCRFVQYVRKRLHWKPAVIIKGGNHEARLEHYLWRNAPELADEPHLTVPTLMKFPETWEYCGAEVHHFMHQDVMITHGRKFSGNVCLGNLRKFRCSVAQGHSHRLGVQYLHDANGEMIAGAECGTLQILQPGYAGVTDWSHGLGWIEDGVLTVEPKV